MVMTFALFYHVFYTLPKYHINRLRYGQLSDEHIKKFGHDYSQLITKDK